MPTRTRLVWQGVIAIVIGVVAIVWPDITIGAFVILYAGWAFADAVFSIIAAVGRRRSASQTRASRGWYILMAVIDVLAGALALTWPDITALVLVLLVAGWALVAGGLQVAMAFMSGESGRERAFFVLTGLVSVGLAVAFVLRPDVGAVTIAVVYGFFSIVTGAAMLVTASSLPAASRASLKVG
jgi:uncharacterized membrane protein HdeD (DUF308 family)